MWILVIIMLSTQEVVLEEKPFPSRKACHDRADEFKLSSDKYLKVCVHDNRGKSKQKKGDLRHGVRREG